MTDSHRPDHIAQPRGSGPRGDRCLLCAYVCDGSHVFMYVCVMYVVDDMISPLPLLLSLLPLLTTASDECRHGTVGLVHHPAAPAARVPGRRGPGEIRRCLSVNAATHTYCTYIHNFFRCVYVWPSSCQSQEKRIILTLRTNEGEYGDLLVTIVASSSPKAARVSTYIHTHRHTYTHTHSHTHIYIYTIHQRQLHTIVLNYMQTYTHTYIHTYIHGY